MTKVDEDASLEFKWLKKRGVGGKKKEVQFYESFIYDGVEYVLYDCVYMYKEGLQEPYIGKLTKIWENADKNKKVKLHWFFRPKEISKWLGDTKTRENEIFFASGEGVGLANICPLEAIAGKCNVICVSKDARNPQPSNEELKAADFIFYRTFDVGSCTILDKMDEKVGGLEIKFIFDIREGENINTLPETTSDKNKNITISSEPQTNKDVPNLVAEKTDFVEPSFGSWVDSKKVEKENPKISEVDKDEANKRKKTPSESDKLHDQPLKKMKLDDKKPTKEKRVELEIARDSEKLTDMPSKKSKVDNVSNQKDSETSKTKDDSKVKDLSKDKGETKVSKNPMGSDKLDVRPLKKIKSFDKEKQVENEDNEKLMDLASKKSKVENPIKSPVESKSKDEDKGKLRDESEGRTLKKTKGEGSFKIPDNKKNNSAMKLSVATNGSNDKNLVATSSKSAVGTNKADESELMDLASKKSKVENPIKSPVESKSKDEDKGKLRDESEGRTLKKTKGEGSFKIPDNKKNNSAMKLSVATNGSNDKNLVATSSKSAVGTNKADESGEGKRKGSMIKSPKVSILSTDKKTMYQEFVVGPKPNADKSGWFRRLPWEQSLKNAYDQGTAVLLHNLDPDYTSGDIEDLIWHAFNESCEAKILPRSAISSPHCYQALVLLKTKEAAQRVLTKLDEECLMLSNGRPLVGTTCPPIIPRKNCKFFGHLTIDKNRILIQREMDEAVSTSHFSQPNTIEYDMAMDWCLLQSRSKKWWDMMHKQQGYELKKLEAKLAQK